MNKKDSILKESFPIFMGIPIPAILIEDNFPLDSPLCKKIKSAYDNYLNYLMRYAKGKNIGINVIKTLSIISDNNLNTKMIISPIGIYTTLSQNLNIVLPTESIDEWKMLLLGKLYFLKTIKSLDELKEKFPFLYEKSYLRHLQDSLAGIEKLKKLGIDAKTFRLMNRKEKRKLHDVKTLSWIFDSMDYVADITKFADDYYYFLQRLIYNIDNIQDYLEKYPIDIRSSDLSDEEIKKMDLLIATAVLYAYNAASASVKDDKTLLYVKNFIDKGEKNYTDDIKIKLRHLYHNAFEHEQDFLQDATDLPYDVITYNDLKQLYEKITQDKEYLNAIDLNIDYFKMSKQELHHVIDNLLENVKNKFKNVSFEKLRERQEKINKNTSCPPARVKSLNQKIDFLLGNMPRTIIEGIGTFTNYWGYVYNNGYVVFDYICADANKSYGHAIYIIRLDDLIKYSDLSLRELRKHHRDKVICIPHKIGWENRVKKIITSYEDAVKVLTLEIFNQLDMAQTFSDIKRIKRNLPVLTDEIEKRINEKEKELQEKEKKKHKIKEQEEKERQRRYEEAREIDNEIKGEQDKIAKELYPSEIDELQEDESRLLSQCGENATFAEMHNVYKKMQKKGKRNSDVSLRTKTRTRDAKGFLHCDLCGVSNRENSLYDSNKSIKMFEAHHIIPISEGGIDNVYNTSCLCPGCHTRIHNYLRLRKKLKEKGQTEFEDGVLGEYMTMAEYGQFLQRVREEIARDTPEYLPNFDQLFLPNSQQYDILSEEQLSLLSLSERESYAKKIAMENDKFSIDWNTPRSR